MSLQVIEKKFVIKFPGRFVPNVNIGTRVEIGTPLGVGQKYRVLQEVPLQAVDEILVDDGVYINSGEPLASSSSILKKSVWLADIEGLVRITKNSIQIVDIIDSYKYSSFVKGRVVYSGADKIVISALFYQFWFFASQGRSVKGQFVFLDNINGIITSKDIPNDLKGKIIFVNGFLTRAIIIKAINAGAIGIFGVSIDYDEYKQLGKILKYINLGVLHGFGQFVKGNALVQLLRNYQNHYIEADFSKEMFYLPVHNLFGINKSFYLYSGFRWGIPVKVDTTKKYALDSNNIIVTIDKFSGQDMVEVDVSEVFNS